MKHPPNDFRSNKVFEEVSYRKLFHCAYLNANRKMIALVLI